MRLTFHPKIGAKLIALIATLLLVSTTALVWSSNHLFVEDNTALIQQMNSDAAANIAAQVREIFANTNDKARMLGNILMRENGGSRGELLQGAFATDPDLLGILVHEATPAGPKLTADALSPSMKQAGLSSAAGILQTLEQAAGLDFKQTLQGNTQVTTANFADGLVALVVSMPFVKNETTGAFTHSVTALVRQERFAKAFSENELVSSFLVDRSARYLAHPNRQLVENAETAGHLEIVSQMLKGKFNNGQTAYTDPKTDEARLGAFRLVGFGGVGVVAEVPEAKAFEAAHRAQFRALLVALVVLSIAFFVGYWYSDTITWPLRQLVAASRRISQGDFQVRLKPRTKDEVGELSVAFNEMAGGLEERERVKATFNKFHNKEIAEKLLSGDVRLGGERREAVIFFSDIRGFTSLSETMQPEEVVEMLNEYMTIMVSVIRKHSGIVDKYVGDAIMALWGVPLDNPNACYDAVAACLEMRVALNELNEKRIQRGQPPLKIGMGLNCGQVIAGNIGSEEKMEYTVIGDSVNLASRIESMTKEFGTDLLIAKSVRDKVTERFVVEQCDSAHVKGKSSAIETFKVVGRFVDGKPTLIITPYSDYPAERSEKVVHGKAA
ncbi:HAMP domain-containing protein [bacterium]|nr:HAMP domain-containing protein [bacterium]